MPEPLLRVSIEWPKPAVGLVTLAWGEGQVDAVIRAAQLPGRQRVVRCLSDGNRGVQMLQLATKPQGVFRQATVIRPTRAEVTSDATRRGKSSAGPVAVERPDATAEIQRGKALPGYAAVMLFAQLHARSEEHTSELQSQSKLV